mgnify:CR=1 FL=1
MLLYVSICPTTVCLYSNSFFFCFIIVFTAHEGVMLLVQLEPSALGALTFYLPILLLDEINQEEQVEA